MKRGGKMPKERKNSRAANGSGSISKRTRIDEKSGKKRIWWEAKVTVGYRSDGKPVRRTVTGSSQAEARAKMLELLEAVENKTYVDQNDLTLSEWLQTWLENYQINVVPSTVHTYKEHIKRYIGPNLGNIKLQKLDEENIAIFISALTRCKLSPKTIHDIHGVLHKALSVALKLKKISKNPATGTDLPALKKPKLHLLDHTEIAALKVAAVGYKYERFFLLALYLGMREGELLGLNVAQINWKQHAIHIDRQLVYDRDNPRIKYIAEPKECEDRILVMPPTVEAILREQLAYVDDLRLHAGNAWIERGLLFPGPNGDYLSRQTVYDCLQRVAKNAGIGPVRVHDLRHTFAALALEAGVDVRTVQGILGHATPEFTLRVYAYVNDHMRKTAAQKLEIAIGTLDKIARGETEEAEDDTILTLNA